MVTVAKTPAPVLGFSKSVISAGGFGAQQGQHLPLPHHQHLQGDDVLQRLPHPCRLSQLHAPLQNPEILQDVRRALQAASAHSLSGEQSLLFDYSLSLFCEPIATS